MQVNLILEDGTVFRGKSFGAPIRSNSEIIGELVFNTSMTGYQEIMTDPSYCDQIITFTYPTIGNYGINRDDMESLKPYFKAVVVKEFCEKPSNWRSSMNIDQYLKTHDIPGIYDIDTRKLTKIIRSHGTMKAIITKTENADEALKNFAFPIDQVNKVSTRSAYKINGKGPRVVVIDFGCKQGILKELEERDFEIIVLPYNSNTDDILAYRPDGLLLSNGPGDPKSLDAFISNIKDLQEVVPIFGICLGHQILALGNGADTTKLKFGHRGANHPVKNLQSGKIAMTSQNHGYAVTIDSIERTSLSITEINLNDNTVQGLEHLFLPVFSVQYHPEANPGPHDTGALFDRFKENILSYLKQDKKVKK